MMPRSDWMMWLLRFSLRAKKINRKTLVLIACACAETALPFVPEGEDRPRKAIEMARAWCARRATLKEVRAAAYAAATAADAAATYAAAVPPGVYDAAYADAVAAVLHSTSSYSVAKRPHSP